MSPKSRENSLIHVLRMDFGTSGGARQRPSAATRPIPLLLRAQVEVFLLFFSCLVLQEKTHESSTSDLLQTEKTGLFFMTSPGEDKAFFHTNTTEL
mmetsp:Transcript_24879/g.36525  ORF Transcript_24879/g.36525 Transcript_24879/m.36525 type:complete len:96 (-) Transcript_24879:816-1103(-)